MNAIEITPLLATDRGARIFETGLTYDGLSPVRIHVTKRGRRLEFSDDGGAVNAAAVDPAAVAFEPEIVMGEHSANVSRSGVVSLPGFTTNSATWLALLPQLVANGSLILFGSLLTLDD